MAQEWNIEMSQAFYMEVWNGYERSRELEEENKKLKKERDLYKARNEELNENCFWLAKENENLKSDLMQDMKEITKLEEENKKLKEENEQLKDKLRILEEWWITTVWLCSLMEEDTLQELRDIGEI